MCVYQLDTAYDVVKHQHGRSTCVCTHPRLETLLLNIDTDPVLVHVPIRDWRRCCQTSTRTQYVCVYPPETKDAAAKHRHGPSMCVCTHSRLQTLVANIDTDPVHVCIPTRDCRRRC